MFSGRESQSEFAHAHHARIPAGKLTLNVESLCVNARREASFLFFPTNKKVQNHTRVRAHGRVRASLRSRSSSRAHCTRVTQRRVSFSMLDDDDDDDATFPCYAISSEESLLTCRFVRSATVHDACSETFWKYSGDRNAPSAEVICSLRELACLSSSLRTARPVAYRAATRCKRFSFLSRFQFDDFTSSKLDHRR